MSANAVTILSQIVASQNSELAPELSEPDFFEVFVAEQATKEFDLSYEELQAGIVDGEHDGGIDSFYTFVNGEIVGEDQELPKFGKHPEMEVLIVQSKSSNGFSEAAINKLISTVGHLFDLEADYGDFTQYNGAVKGRAEIFRETFRSLIPVFPKLKVRYILAAKHASAQPHENTRKKSDELIERTRSLFGDVEVDFRFWGAAEMVELSRRTKSQSFSIRFTQSLPGSQGYVALVKLSDFNTFLRDHDGAIRYDLFESNVRDFQGSTEVNADILETLNAGGVDEFWWFNNGVTILAARATSSGQLITVENPQIVNGLQTSSQIGAYFSSDRPGEERTVLVKIVASEDEEVRDKIIKATNYQNPVPIASLRATDTIQRDIEHHLKSNGLFYDRRKNFYKNEGKPASKIISIPLLAQASMTLFNGEPDNARARPSSLLKGEGKYEQLFSSAHPLDSYLVAAQVIRAIETKLRETPNLSSRDRNNLRFYVLFWVVAMAARSVSLSPAKVANQKGKISVKEIEAAIEKSLEVFDKLGRTDQVAKGPNFKVALKAALSDEFRQLSRAE